MENTKVVANARTVVTTRKASTVMNVNQDFTDPMEDISMTRMSANVSLTHSIITIIIVPWTTLKKYYITIDK